MEEKKDIVFGIAGIAELFKCSKTTAAKIRREIIAPAVHQDGRYIYTERQKALDLYSAWRIKLIEARQQHYEDTRAIRNERSRICKARARAAKKNQGSASEKK